MCHRCSACCLSHLRGSDDGDDDDDVRPLNSLFSSCDEIKDSFCLVPIISICRACEQAAEGEFSSQAEPQRGSGHGGKLLLLACVLFVLLAVSFLMGSVGKGDSDAQDYDADVFLPSKALWLLGCLLSWTVWSLLRLLQVFLWLIKGLLWFISISVSPLCRCVSFLQSCALLLLHYTCDAVFFATNCPAYVYSMLLSVVSLHNVYLILILILTRL
ncbi:uncharacterized protein LOC144463824 [Epinephelus lanceolatus]